MKNSHTPEMYNSFLGIPRHIFDARNDISDPFIKRLLDTGKFFVETEDFCEDGYASLWEYISFGENSQVKMGTGYAIASEKYLERRGNIQRIDFLSDAQVIGKAKITEEGREKEISIYLITSAERPNGSPIGATANAKLLAEAIHKILFT